MGQKLLFYSAILLLLTCSSTLQGQGIESDVRRVVSSCGNQFKGESLRVSYTIGEPVIHTAKTSDRGYTQGFHQGPMAIAEMFDIEVYNAFSPNADGTNETWIIDRIEFYPDNEVLIFNRWGDKLHHFKGYDNDEKVWKGKNSNGKLLPAGTYFYVIKAGDGRSKKGYVQITK